MRRLAATAVALLLAITCMYAQKVSLSGSNLPLATVLDSIRQQTGFAVFAPKNIFDNTKPVDLSIKNLPVYDALKLVLHNQPLSFEIASKTIFISPDSSKITASANVNEQPSDPGFYGYVYNGNGQPLEAATITNLSTRSTAMADQNGFFRISGKQGDEVQISSVGYVTQLTQLNKSRRRLNIHLQVKESVLDEATVVAYGTTTRRETTGSISIVKGREFSGLPSPSFSNMLQGRATGLDITNVSGAPGSGGTLITVRGYNSLDVEQGRTFSNPLWVVDDVPLNAFTSPVTGTNLLVDINPDFIESIQVLKDASAAALYGSRASNGVIIVRTKKGRFNQKSEFRINASQSFNAAAELPTITIGKAERDLRLRAFLNFPRAFVQQSPNMYVYPTNYREVYLNPSSSLDYLSSRASNGKTIYLQDSLNPFFNNSTNFFPAYYRTGATTNVNIQAYGGSSNMHYGITSGFYNQRGIIRGSGFTRFDLNSTLHVQPSTSVSIEARMNGSFVDRGRADKSLSLFGEASPVIETAPYELFQLSSLFPAEGSSVWRDLQLRLNERRETNRSARFRTNLRLNYDVTKQISLTTSIAADYAVHRRNNFSPSTINSDTFSRTQGEAAENLILLNENLITYKTKIREHDLAVVAGVSYQFDQEDYNGGEARNSPSDRIYYARPGFPLLGERTVIADNGVIVTETIAFQKFLSDMTQKALLSYFGRWEYNYLKKYYATFTLRRDGSSVFGESTRWGTFPSLAAGWIFTEEKKIASNLRVINFGKLRGSWGRTGMQFSQNYLALGIMQAGRYPYQGRGVILPEYNEGLYNEKLTWEETTQFDGGFDVEMFNSRLSITADYFARFTKNMLMPVRLPGTYNGYLAQWRNAAAISNRGVEASISYNIFRSVPLSWKLTLNATHVWNRFERSFNNKDITSEHTTVNRRWDLGKPLNGIYGLRTNGLVQAQDQLPIFYNRRGTAYYLARDPDFFYKPGDPWFIDQNHDGEINQRDEVYLGSALPKVSGGIFSQLAWKSLEVDVLFTYQLSRHIVNAVPVSSLRTNDRDDYLHPLLIDLSTISFWQQKGDNAHFSPIQYDAGSGVYDVMVDRYVERVNWMKLKSIVARFTLPQRFSQKIKTDHVQLFVSGENLWLLTNYSGIDPETVSVTTSVDYGKNYPLARQVTVGINIKF